jgi:hypothetical protein
MRPVTVNFTGDDEILQGADCEFLIPMPQDMTEFDPALTPGALLRGAVKQAAGGKTLLSSHDGTIILSFADPLNLRVQFPNAGTTAAGAFANYPFDVEARSGFTGLISRIAEGVATNRREITTESD